MKTSFLEGRTFVDLDDLNHQLEVWLDTVANVRLHGTTHARPVDRYAQELPHLRPLAGVPVYDVRPVEFRQVPSDCHISYHSVPYSVAPEAVGRTVMVRPEGEEVGAVFSVYLGDTQVARHHRRPSGHLAVTLPEHRQAIRALTRDPSAPRARRRGRTPRFEQTTTDQIDPNRPDLSIWSDPTLDVQTRSLEEYEQQVAETQEVAA